MIERVIVIEQRLRTKGLVFLLAIVTVVYAAVAIALTAGTGRHSPSALTIVIESIAFVSLIAAIFFFLRITVRVVATPQGRALEVVYGPGGLVRQVFGPDKLVGADARNFSFLQMGGWGYRGSLKVFRRAALATRRGDALDVRLQGNRRFIVTVDDPADFVSALALLKN